jgi:drug/metabolite transporter (DMT)-like permease
MSIFFLYLATVLIWGSTWLAITFQLGAIDPLVSIGYRFFIASVLLLAYCIVSGKNLRFSIRAHTFMLLLGVCLFGLNYWLFYLASAQLTSVLVAVTFSTVVLMNTINGRLFIGTPIRPIVIVAALIGLVGIMLVFWPEVQNFHLADQGVVVLGMTMLATYFASLGNIISARNQKQKIPILQANAFGMGYGALLMFIIAFFMGKPFGFDSNLAYVGSLLYLSVFGSIVAFGCYLTLIGRIGADKAAYASLLFPIVALQLSVWFEGYQWNAQSLIGTALILFGNLIILLPDRLLRRWVWKPVACRAPL